MKTALEKILQRNEHFSFEFILQKPCDQPNQRNPEISHNLDFPSGKLHN
jgi:hypothetical protein